MIMRPATESATKNYKKCGFYAHDIDSSSQVQLLFRTLANTSHQRTGLVYSPLRGDVATYQPKLIA